MRRLFRLLQHLLRDCGDRGRADPTGADQPGVGEPEPLQKLPVAGEDIRKEPFVGVSLGKDDDELLGIEPARLGTGMEVGLEVREGPVDKPLELGGDLAIIDLRGEHHHVRLLHRGQHPGQVVLQHAVIEAVLAGIASLAAAVGQPFSSKVAHFGTEPRDALREMVGDG